MRNFFWILGHVLMVGGFLAAALILGLSLLSGPFLYSYVGAVVCFVGFLIMLLSINW